MIFCNLKKITIYIQYIKILILVVGGICHLFWGGGEGKDLFFSFFFSLFSHQFTGESLKNEVGFKPHSLRL